VSEETEEHERKGIDWRILAIAFGASAVMLAVAYFLDKKPCLPCKEHSTGEQPLTEVAKASADMAQSAPPQVPPVPNTAPGGNSLALGEPKGFAPRETQLPKPDNGKVR